MGHQEDFWYEITESINNRGLKEEFDTQLKKMQYQDKHRYKNTRDKWDYAHLNEIEHSRKKA